MAPGGHDHVMLAAASLAEAALPELPAVPPLRAAT